MGIGYEENDKMIYACLFIAVVCLCGISYNIGKSVTFNEYNERFEKIIKEQEKIIKRYNNE